MNTDRRRLLTLGAALPFLAGASPAPAPVDVAGAWRRLFAGPPGETFVWWLQGVLFAHVDGLREFPVLGQHAVMICRTSDMGPSTVLDFRTIGFFSDLDSGEPASAWDNPFTGRREAIPKLFTEGPGQYRMTPQADGGAGLALTSQQTRTNRAIATAEAKEGQIRLSQVEGTLQGFPRLDGTLPLLDDPSVTERQTRLEVVGLQGAATATRGFFAHVYDALPPWMGFGDRLGSGLSKGVMRRAAADQPLNPAAWAYLKARAPQSFAGDRLVLT